MTYLLACLRIVVPNEGVDLDYLTTIWNGIHYTYIKFDHQGYTLDQGDGDMVADDRGASISAIAEKVPLGNQIEWEIGTPCYDRQRSRFV